MENKLDIIATAMENSFKKRIATLADIPFDKTGVTAPKREIWEAYAKDVLEALGENDAH